MPTEPITTAGYRITDTLQLITIVLFTMHRSTTDGDTITIPGTDITTTITLLIAYPSASPWLTDYILSENLRAAYAAGLVGEAQPYGPSGEDLASLWSSDSLITSNLEAIHGAALQVQKAAPASQAELTPEVKQALADEVKTQIADKAAAAKSQDSAGKGDELPAALDPKHRIFVVASTITVTATEDGSECQWTQGDIIDAQRHRRL